LTKILIADDHAIVRRGLKEILQRDIEGLCCGEADDSQSVLARIQAEHWDLVILDISMPGRSGLDVLADVRRLQPEIRVLVLTMHSEDQYGKRVLKAGAFGYMNKESAPEELIKAVRKIAAGGRYVSAGLAEKLAWNLQRDEERPPHEGLSNREFEILRNIAWGKTVSQIAEQLHVSATTVSTHRARILEKMQMTNTAELIRYAVLHALID
jgi:two-component system, NarL family, invasion response regulator UvrY